MGLTRELVSTCGKVSDVDDDDDGTDMPLRHDTNNKKNFLTRYPRVS